MTDKNIDDKNLQSLKFKSSSKIFANQMKALLKKRFIYFSRDKISLLC